MLTPIARRRAKLSRWTEGAALPGQPQLSARNFVRIRHALLMTPAMAVWVTARLRDVEDGAAQLG